MVIESVVFSGGMFWSFNHVVSCCLCCFITQSSKQPFLSVIMIAKCSSMYSCVNKRCSAVHQGGTHDGRLFGRGAYDQELNGDTRRRDNDLDRFGPSDRRNTLRLVSLVYCIEYEI